MFDQGVEVADRERELSDWVRLSVPAVSNFCYSHVTVDASVAADRPTLWKCTVISILGRQKRGTIFLGEGVNSGTCCPPERIHCSLVFQLLSSQQSIGTQ
jgi:hypothetical protein